MKKETIKQVRSENLKPATVKKQSKPRKTGLSKSDPDYYAKIGAISAKKRKMSSADFSAMAKKSHPRPGGYHGGRPKKSVSAE